MGVTGLWKLIDASGKPVPIETLENKVLAIDISIWLHQVVKGFQDNKGSQLSNAHLLGLFHRLCKLLYYRIKPVFVFDGGVPQLKRETIAKRNQSKNKLLDEAERVQNLILSALAKEKVVQQALGPNAVEILTSPVKPAKPNQKPDKDDMFKLPDSPSNRFPTLDTEVPDESISSVTESESSFEEPNLREAYAVNLQSIDVTSAHFKSLPADIRHEILTDIKETRKQSSWGRLHELPAHSDDFSEFQMKRLLKRRQVQVSLEEAEQQMGGKSLTLTELQTLLTEDGVIADSAFGATRRIASDENTRFLLVRDMKKAVEKAIKGEPNPMTSIKEESEIKEEKPEGIELLGQEFDTDLQKAIEMSLKPDGVYKDEDYDEGSVKMNKQQKERLKNATSLARAYMIEYGGMNDDEINDLMEQSQIEETQKESGSTPYKYNDKFITKGEICTPYRSMADKLRELQKAKLLEKESDSDYDATTSLVDEKPLTKEEQPSTSEVQVMSDSDEDSDFEDVPESSKPTIKEEPVGEAPEMKIVNKQLEVVVDLNAQMDSNDDDIFADIFSGEVADKKEVTTTEKKTETCVDSEDKDMVEIPSSSEEIEQQDEKSSSQAESKDTIEIPSSVESIQITSQSKSDQKSVSDDFVEISSSLEPSMSQDGKVNDDVIEIPSSVEESKVVQPEQILSKLKADLENISKITLDEIDVPVECNDPKTLESKIIVKPSEDPKLILENLKKQIAEIPKIDLDLIEISEPTEVNKGADCTEVDVKPEIIEILDETAETQTRPDAKTPSKGKIDNFFETKYVIKRTPDKVKEENEDVPKVVSPFFVPKTPKSGSSGKRKKRRDLLEHSDDEEITTPKKDRRVSKALFEKSMDDDISDVRPLEPESVNPIEIAAQTLRENKTREELQDIASEIAKERRELEVERNRQGRMGTSITEKMSYDCQSLLRLFGVPYVVAPMEAEAQCAFLDVIKLTDGTITDDSDIWLFGGQTVYKNFFNDKKHVMEFKVENIEKLYNMDRVKLIQLAILVGSDYTSGISGIGAVTALEILSAFARTPMKEGETNEIMSVLSSLRKFRDWWRESRNIGPTARTGLRNKLKNIQLTEGFPNSNIVDAYLHPKVDDNRDAFSWGKPDVETIREFAKKNFGWTTTKTDEILNPVLKKMNEKKSQASIKNYFSIKSALSTKELKVSKRVQKAINKMSADYKSDEEEPKVKKPRKKVKKATEKSIACVDETATDSNASKSPEKTKRQPRGKRTKKPAEPSPERELSALEGEVRAQIEKKFTEAKKAKLAVNTKEKDMEEMEKRKEMAAQLFKKSREAEKPKKC